MRTNRLIAVLALFLPVLSHAECIKDHRTSKTFGVLVAEFHIVGTQTLNSEEVSSLTGDLIGSCFNDSAQELEEWIRASFQNRGYFMTAVKNVRIKADDPLSVPKPVAIEAEVVEGPRCKFGEIRFKGNHAFSTEKLRSVFPVKKGNVFERDKIAQAFDSVRKLYLAEGYLDITFVPKTKIVGDRVALDIDVDEGSQFHMGKLSVFAKGEQADKLRAAWGISEGAVFDRSYLEKYIESNQALLPANFTTEFVQVVQNCRESTVEVRLPIDQLDPRSQILPRAIDCDAQDARVQR
jgi:outer membrane protein assembly factor BamA